MSPAMPHGRITGHYGVALPAIGGEPQEGPTLPAAGIIIFRPEVERLLISQGEEEPETLIPAPVTCILDAAGDLINPDEPGVKGVSLLANQDIPDMNPGSWLWRAHIILTHAGHTIWQTSFPVPVHAGVTSDLADLAPVSTEDGDIVRGAKGDSGERGPEGLEGRQGEPGERGADGYQGVDGAPGPAPRISVGSVAKGRDAAVTVTGTSPDLTLDFIVPEGGGSFATIPEQFERFGKIRVQFDGKAEPTFDGYRCLNGYQPAPGDRVAMVTVDSELIIAGRVGGIVNTPPPFTMVPVDPVDPWKNADVYRYGDIRACKTSQDWVALTGVVEAPSGLSAGDTILQLPGTHRPRVRELYSLATLNRVNGRPTSATSVYVEEDGRVTLVNSIPGGTWVSLSGITFNNSLWGVVTVNSEVSYRVDAYGLLGLSGTTGSAGSTVFPGLTGSTQYAERTPMGAGVNYFSAAWTATDRPSFTGSYSYSASRWQTSATPGLIWNTVPLQNGYDASSSTMAPLQYAVRPDGLVQLRGRIQNGLSDSVVAVLPEGVRPPYEILGGLSTPADRYVITPGGSILGPTTTAKAGLYFMNHLYFPSH